MQTFGRTVVNIKKNNSECPPEIQYCKLDSVKLTPDGVKRFDAYGNTKLGHEGDKLLTLKLK